MIGSSKALLQAAAGYAATESGYDIANASYDSVSFSVSGQDTNPRDIIFNSDGTKLYLTGTQNDKVYQYSLSTAYDLSTASYDSVSFSVSGQSTAPASVHFKPDGTKMYVAGFNTDSVYQYTLSTGYDLSTASYDSVSFSFSSQDGTPQDVFFHTDGTSLYMVGSDNDTIYQYSLSTAWDISTASYASKSFSVSSQETTPQSIFIKSDGSKVFLLGYASDAVYQYSLSTAWDISTASYDNVSFSVVAQSTVGVGLTFKPDGTKMYISDTTADAIFQYST